MTASSQPPAHKGAGGYNELKHNAMGTAGVTFLVLAGITPLGAFMAILPLGIGFGNGAGYPGVVLLGVIALYCFAVGYVAMSKKIPSAGAFYAYISRGISRPFGVGAALIAVVAYLALVMSMAGNEGFFASSAIQTNFGVDVPWWAVSIGVLVIAGLLATRGIDVSAKILAVLCCFEFIIVMMVVVAIVVKDGISAFTLSSFNPSVMIQGAPGVALVFAFCLFVGFEATAIYSEESRDPKKTIGRATYISLATISAFYVFVSMALVAAYGSANVQEVAAADPGMFAIATADIYLGSWAGKLMEWGILGGLFAALLGIHNSVSRYGFAMGRSHLFPRSLGHVSQRYGSPVVASLCASVIEIIVVVICAVGGVDPFIGLGGVGAAVSTFGIILLQAVAACSVVGFFWRRSDRTLFQTIIAPGVGAIMLFFATGLTIKYFSALTGSQVQWINALPYVVIAVGVAGGAYALWLRTAKPQTYQDIVRSMEDETMEELLAREMQELELAEPGSRTEA